MAGLAPGDAFEGGLASGLAPVGEEEGFAGKGTDTGLALTLAGAAEPPLGAGGWGIPVSPVTDEAEAGLAAAGAEPVSGFAWAGASAVPACLEDTGVAEGLGVDEVGPVSAGGAAGLGSDCPAAPPTCPDGACVPT